MVTSCQIPIWHWPLIIADEEQRGSLLNLLEKDEVARANRLRSATHRNEFIAARAGLRILLAKILDEDPSEQENIISQFPDIAKQLCLRLAEYDTWDPGTNPETPEPLSWQRSRGRSVPRPRWSYDPGSCESEVQVRDIETQNVIFSCTGDSDCEGFTPFHEGLTHVQCNSGVVLDHEAVVLELKESILCDAERELTLRTVFSRNGENINEVLRHYPCASDAVEDIEVDVLLP